MTRETELREALANRWRVEADAIDASLAVLRRAEAAGSESARLLLHGKSERQLRAMIRRDTLLECAAALAALAVEPEQGDEVAGLDLSDEQAAILRKHLASRQQTVSEFFGDVLMDMGLGRVAGRDYPGAVRLVPVRDGGPTRGEQIIRENAEIAGSNPATALFPPRDDTP